MSLQFRLLLAAFCLATLYSHAQTNTISMKGDTLMLGNGAQFYEGEEIILGAGSAPDRSFNHIFSSPGVFSSKHTPMSGEFNGKMARVKKFEKDGSYKKSYAFNILVLDMGNGKSFWCEVQGAFESGELIVPGLNDRKTADLKMATAKPDPPPSPEVKPTPDPKPPVSIADELTKLKKLLDSGAITKDEYASLKKKLISSQP